jgi:hypothetical protein
MESNCKRADGVERYRGELEKFGILAGGTDSSLSKSIMDKFKQSLRHNEAHAPKRVLYVLAHSLES